MRLFIFPVLIFLLYLVNKSQGQGINDSAAITEIQAVFKLINQKPDSVLAIAEKALLQSQHSGNKRLAALAYKTRGWAWMRKGFFEKTFPDLLLSAQLFKQLNDTQEEMRLFINLGLAYSNHSEFAISARYLLMADSLAQEFNDQKAIADIKRQMGILYRVQDQYGKAIPYFRESIEMYSSLHDTLSFLASAFSLCRVYMLMAKPDSSLTILGECNPLVNALHEANYERSMMQERYGDAYYALAKYDKALESYGKAYRIFADNNNKSDMAYEAMNLGRTFVHLKKYRDAENYLLLSYRISDSVKMTHYIRDVSGQLADLFKETGDWRKAYHWAEIFDSSQDNLQMVTQNEKIAQLQAQYEADKKEKEITLLKKDQELNHAIVQRQKAIQRGTLVLVILLLLIGVLVINRYRTAQRSRRLIELEKMRNNIARDLHDDMGSALSSINIISKVALKNAGEEQKVNEHLKKIHESSGLILENMSDIVWTINPVNDTLEKIVFKMREFAADLFDPMGIEFVFVRKGNLQDVKMGLQIRKDLYLIFKEAVNNTAKYSGCTKVNIAISRNDRQIEMQVKDNGVGFSWSNIREGNGLKNMEERAKQINGHLTISSEPGNGTTVTLFVKSHD